MIQKLLKLVSNPAKYFNIAVQLILQKNSKWFRNASFYLQGQMDIHEKSMWYGEEFNKSTGGFFLKKETVNRQIVNLEPWDNTRRDMLVLLLRTIVEKQISGDIAEVGVYKGQTARLIHYFIPERKLYLFDTFEGFTSRSVSTEKKHTDYEIPASQFSDTSLKEVKKYISPLTTNITFCKGYFPESIPQECNNNFFALVHLDADLYEPTSEGLKYFYPKMSNKGIIVIHDYNSWIGARKAVDEFFKDKPELPIPMPDKSGSVIIVKQ